MSSQDSSIPIWPASPTRQNDSISSSKSPTISCQSSPPSTPPSTSPASRSNPSSTGSTSSPKTTRNSITTHPPTIVKGDDHPGHRPFLFPFFSFMPALSSTTRCHRVLLPTKNHQKIPLDYQPLNANAYFLPCNCMFLKCICNALAYAKVFQMSSFFQIYCPIYAIA